MIRDIKRFLTDGGPDLDERRLVGDLLGLLDRAPDGVEIVVACTDLRS
jgi:hypothetical protein